MKLLGLALAVFCAVPAFASTEKVVLEVSKSAARGILTTRFEVNLQDGTAGASMTATRQISRGSRSHRTIKRNFEALIPELSLVGDSLIYESAEGPVNCGTMGETRIFKRPVLNLSGDCSLVTRRAGNKVQLVLVTK